MNLYNTLLDKMGGKEYVGYFSTYCVFEDHKSPALMVYERSYTKNWEFRCLSCNRHGSLEQLAKKIKATLSVTRSQKSQVLPRWRDWERQWGNLQGIADHAHKSLLRSPKSWFKKRGIDEFIKQGHFGYQDGWCLFPVFSSDRMVVDIVVRAISGKGTTRYTVSSIVDNSIVRSLYIPNWKRVDNSRTVYVVFGIIDSWALEAIGLPCVTGITGKAIPVDRLRELHKKLIIIPDLGEEEDAHKIANQFGMGARVKELAYPEDCKDSDEIRMRHGNDMLYNLIMK